MDAAASRGILYLNCHIVLAVPVHLVEHPIAHDALLALRDKTTSSREFRQLAHRISLVLAMEATRDLATTVISVDTPLERVSGRALRSDVVVVPVLRAGLGMQLFECGAELVVGGRVLRELPKRAAAIAQVAGDRRGGCRKLA